MARRPRTASSARPVGDQSASPSNRPSPQVIGCRPTRTKLGRIDSVWASTQASNAPSLAPSVEGPSMRLVVAPTVDGARVLQDDPRFEGTPKHVEPEARAVGDGPVVLLIEIAPVHRAHPHLDDGRNLPVAHRDLLRRGRSHLRAGVAGPSRDGTRASDDGAHPGREGALPRRRTQGRTGRPHRRAPCTKPRHAPEANTPRVASTAPRLHDVPRQGEQRLALVERADRW